MQTWCPLDKLCSKIINISSFISIHFIQTAALEFSKTREEFAHLLQFCISENIYSDFRGLQGVIIVSGLPSDVYVNNLLLSAYAKHGRINDAYRLFDKMPQRNMVTWSSIISSYAQHGDGEEALLLFSQFRRCFFGNPNEYVLASVLRACSQLRAVDQATQIHSFIIKASLDSDVYAATALLDVYSKNVDMEHARHLFDDMPVKNAVTWTVMITAYSNFGESEISLRLFKQMRKTEIPVDRYVLSSVISACSELVAREAGMQIHGSVVKSELGTDVSVINVLIDFYLKCNNVKIAQILFDHMAFKNVVSWTTLIAGYMQHNCDWLAIELFSEMNRQGYNPDGFTCTSILSSCGSLGALTQGEQIHCYTVKTNLDSDSFAKNGLIDMYAKCDSLLSARKAFDVIAEHDEVSFNAMIECYSRQTEIEEAFSLFNHMRYTSLNPSPLTFVSLLRVSSSLSALNLSKQIHGLIIRFGVSLDLYAGSSLVDVYSKCSFVHDAKSVFDEMKDKDIVLWNAMIAGYTQNFLGENAINLFLDMQLTVRKPDEFTYVALITSAGGLASLFHGSQFHCQVIKTGYESESYVSNALVDMYAKCGTVEEAKKLFDTMNRRDVVCWNSMISKYAQHGHVEEALKMFERMIYEKIAPNYVTFVGVLSACSHAGLMEVGLNHFRSMKDEYSIEPGADHCACIVALLGRSGKLQEAKKFIEDMPVEPTAIVWRSLLGACRLNGNMDLGRYAAEMAMSVEPKGSGPYVLLSNIFASKGMWADVEKVRDGMDSAGVVKEPGHSWIEIKGESNVFIAESQTHKEIDVIYSLLQTLTDHMKQLGYLSVIVADH